MLDIQLGRRNLFPIQRIAVAEKYRPMYEKEAKANQSKAGKEYGNGGTKLTANLPQAFDKEKKNVIQLLIKKLADIADVSEKMYRMGSKILNSDDEELKKRVQLGETSISAGYKELIEKNKTKKEDMNNETIATPSQTIQKETPTIKKGWRVWAPLKKKKFY